MGSDESGEKGVAGVSRAVDSHVRDAQGDIERVADLHSSSSSSASASSATREREEPLTSSARRMCWLSYAPCSLRWRRSSCQARTLSRSSWRGSPSDGRTVDCSGGRSIGREEKAIFI